MRLSRRDFLATGATLPLVGNAMFKGKKRPSNVLIILADQHGGQFLGCAGHPMVKTPHLDRLAAEGVRFTNAVANNPVCAPFRAMLQTGEYWFKNGVFANDQRAREDLPGFAEVFAQHGYTTGYIGKWHLDGGIPSPLPGGYVPPERRKGWQEWEGYEKGHAFKNVYRMTEAGREVVEGYDWEPTWHTDQTLDFIRRNKEKPWLYMVSYGPPHLPEECKQEFLDMYPLESIQLTPAQERNIHSPEERQRMLEMMQMYMALVTSVDYEVGRLLDGIQEMGLDEDTLIMYITDQGDVLGTNAHIGVTTQRRYGPETGLPSFRGKACPSMYALNIPLIFRQPGVIRPGQTVDTPVGVIDIAPTLLDYARLPIPRTMVGESRWSWCMQGEGPEENTLYVGNDRRFCGFFDGRYLFGEGAGEANQVLFDLHNDPEEMHNLYGEDPARTAEFRKRVLEMAQRLGERPNQIRMISDRMQETV